MKEIEYDDRRPKLIEEAKRLNAWIDKRRWETEFEIETDFKVRFQGLTFPMRTGDDEDPTLILRVIPEKGHVFRTKERAPIMLCFETIQFSEAKENLAKLTAENQRLRVSAKQESISPKRSEREERKEISEELKIDLEQHMEEGEMAVSGADPEALINNPFTGEADEELYTPSPMKAKKLSQLEGHRTQTK